MGELHPALDALAADDLKPMFGPQLLERLGDLLRAQNALAAEITRTVRECELTQASKHDGLKSMQSWLRGHGHLSSTAAARLVHSGRAMEHLPAVAAAFAEGAVTAEQVTVVARTLTPENLARVRAQEVDLPGFDHLWATVAAGRPHEDLVTVVGQFQDALDPDGPGPDPTEGRRLSLAKHPDGSITGRFDLDAVGGETLQAALESIVQAARPVGDLRTRAQQQADALVQLADNALAWGELPRLRTVNPQVRVLIGLEDLVDPATGTKAATAGFGAVLSAAKARWIACDAGTARVVLEPDGQPVDIGREKRIVPPHIRRAVEVRDRHCVFAGCYAPSHWCDTHLPATPRGPRRACESWGGGGPSTYEGPPRVPDPP